MIQGETYFTRRGRTIENIPSLPPPPPTDAALNEHVKRSVLQARKWYQYLVATKVELDPVH